MHRTRTPDARIAWRAARQHGVFTKEQALAAGITERQIQYRVATGRWEALAPGVFRIRGAPETFEQEVMAECLAAGERSFASHLTAGALFKLDGVHRSGIDVAVPHGCWHPPGVRQLRNLKPSDVTQIGVIPITSPIRTVIDIAAVAGRRVAEAALDDGVRRGLFALDGLAARLNELPGCGRRGHRLLCDLVAIRRPLNMVPRSALESRVLWILSVAGLPIPQLQFPVLRVNAKRALIDYAYPDHKVALEIDGRLYHSGTLQLQRDGVRARDLERMGWVVVRLTSLELDHDPVRACRKIASALGVRISRSCLRRLHLAT